MVSLWQGRFQCFHWGGAASPGGAVLAMEGAQYVPRGRHHGRIGAISYQKGASPGGRGTVAAWKGALVGQKGVFSYQKGASAGGTAPI